MSKTTYIVICQSAWCNSQGIGIDYNWDGQEFDTRTEAIRHGFAIRESDDFNVGVLRGGKLASFDWMERPTGETPETLQEIAAAIGTKVAHPSKDQDHAE